MKKLMYKALRLFLPKNVKKFLNGYKSTLGIVGLIACIALPYFGIEVPDSLIKAFEALLGIGLVHKISKAKEPVDELKSLVEDSMKEFKK